MNWLGASRRVAILARLLLSAGVAILVGSVDAGASGFFYNELVREGRIYVFADPAAFRQFEATGRRREAWISREGYGPNGETVVFDSEDAINLYNFRHGLPGESRAAGETRRYPAGRFSGLVFGDFYDYDRYHQDEVGDGNTSSVEGQLGFWLRRIYLTYDVEFSERISARVRLEANSNGRFEGGNLEPYVKDASLRWTYAGRHQATLGIHPALTFDWVEGFWGLRHIEKTPADLYRIDSSRDLGISFGGPVLLEGLSYAVQWGNDSGQGSETDEYKAWRAEVRYGPPSGFGANVVYVASARDEDADRETWSGFAGYRAETWRVAGNYLRQEREAAAGSPDPRTQRIDIWSLFAVWEFLPEKASLFGRCDDVEGRKGDETTGLPGADGIDYWLLSPAAPFRTFIVGGEWYLLPAVRVSPNVERVRYHDDPDPVGFPGRDENRIYRLTFFWSW